MGLFGTAVLNHYSICYDGSLGDLNDTIPALAGGLSFLVSDFMVSTGLTYIMGEHDDSVGLIAAASMALGS
jgi:hypothetical protein